MESSTADAPRLDLRVGTDLVHVPDIAASIDTFGHRYLQRVYSPGEIEHCTSPDGRVSAERLAARFAAKEAVIKALRPPFGVDYRGIEVVGDPLGGPMVVLHDDESAPAGVRRLAATGVLSSSVSLTHDGSYASAVYVALTASTATAGTFSSDPANNTTGATR